MASTSPAETEQQFRAYRDYPSNLDLCNRCGRPRSAHGPDWSCPPKPARGVAAVSLFLGGLLTLGGLILQVTRGADRALAQVIAAAIFVGVTLLVAGFIMARRLLSWPAGFYHGPPTEIGVRLLPSQTAMITKTFESGQTENPS
jgi:hypothetical protein